MAANGLPSDVCKPTQGGRSPSQARMSASWLDARGLISTRGQIAEPHQGIVSPHVAEKCVRTQTSRMSHSGQAIIRKGSLIVSGETNLTTLISSMNPVLHPDVYVFAKTTDADRAGNTSAKMIFEEAEAITLILKRPEAERQQLSYEFPCRMITLNIHSALDAVGFIAAVTTELARHGIGVNPVSGFYHDHLFVPADRANDAMQALKALIKSQAEVA